MPLFSSFGWIESYVNRMVESRLTEWQVQTYTENVFLHKIPEERIEAKRREIRREVESSVYFWRAWWGDDEDEDEDREDQKP